MNNKKKIITFVLAFVMGMLSITVEAEEIMKINIENEQVGCLVDEKESETATILDSEKHFVEGDKYQATDFTISFNGVDYYGVCSQRSETPPQVGSSATVNLVKNDELRKVLFYGNNGPANLGYGSVETILAASIANGDTGLASGSAGVDEGYPLYNQAQALPCPSDNFHVYKTNFGNQQDVVFSVYDVGDLKLIKKTSNQEFTEENNAYSLEGAEYKVYKNAECTEFVDTLVVKEDGTSNIITGLEVGTYYVKESIAPQGYALDSEIYEVSVTKGEESVLELEDSPQYSEMRILLEKKDKEIKKNQAQGDASLKGAEFLAKFYPILLENEEIEPSAEGIEASRTWKFRTDENGFAYYSQEYLVGGDEFYLTSKGEVVLPLGTLTIQEIKAPEGYLKNNNIYVRQITSEGTDIIVDTYSEVIVEEDIIRGDLELVKVSDGDMKRLSGVPFKLTHIKSGESHVIVTDQNGYVSTHSNWNKHSSNTNSGESDIDGVWFGNLSALDDDKGAMLYGMYLVEELPCESNHNMKLIPPFSVMIYKENVRIDLGTLTNDYIPEPKIQTQARDAESGKNEGCIRDEIKLVDEVAYENLIPQDEYTIKGILMDVKTKAPLLIEGKEVVVMHTFKPESKNGVEKVEFKFSGKKLMGNLDIVVFETLYDDRGEQIVAHHNFEDKQQTVKYIYTPVIKAPQTGDEVNITL